MTYQAVYEDLPHGAIYIEDTELGYANVVEVTDLDSACGTTDMVLIDSGSCGVNYGYRFSDRPLTNIRANFDSAMNGAGPGGHEHFKISGRSRETARMIAYQALWSYGNRDIESSIVIATSPDWSANGESWEPDIIVDDASEIVDVLAEQFGIEASW